MELQDCRVLLVADNVSARFGGEAILPLHYFRVLRSRGVEAWMLMHSRTRDEMRSLFPQDEDRIFYIPDLLIHRMLYRIGKWLPDLVALLSTGLVMGLVTQYLQRKLARRLVREKGVNVVHQPTPVSPKLPSMLFDVGAPVVIGPMNGGMTYPPGMRQLESRVERLAVALGRAGSNVMNWLIPGKLRARVLMVANERTRGALPAGHKGVVVHLPENGVDLRLWQKVDRQPTGRDERVRFAFLGRLVELKGVDLLLEALPVVLKQAPVCVDIIGDGPMRDRWQGMARELGISEHVAFTGWLAQSQCAERLASADALVLPSLRECGGAVVLEAMAIGLPVIASNWGGPPDYLDAGCGILVDPVSRESMIRQLAEAMVKLAVSPELRQRLGANGRQRVIDCFDWEAKVDRILDIYRAARESGKQAAS